ncbi:sodium/glutamate symporter [Brackiella oedipodis]|uniref:sodium/glutamate symporter n=1 Tax=Brackiella oedipodis TaxID=124225 RepID=UPI00048AF54A|nr:sodium/glutamate symporter [Brackiella oedipodis]
MEFELNGVYTLIIATFVLILGRLLVSKVKFLSDFNIPEPVAGGLVAAIIIFILRMWPSWFGASESLALKFTFDTDLQTFFMLMFFTSIGLAADFKRLKAGGMPLVIFLVVVSFFIMIQDGVGVAMASGLGLDPLIGLVAGSVTLTGGHGTAAAWGDIFEKMGVSGATTLGIATATFGLVSGGLIGGPVARFLIKKIKREQVSSTEDNFALGKVANRQSLFRTSKNARTDDGSDRQSDDMFNRRDEMRLITTSSAIETLTLFAVCLAVADILSAVTAGTYIELPTFVWALATGVVLRNVLTHLFSFDMFDRAIDVFGNASLSLYLAIALLSLRVWELADLALPVLVILAVQVVVMMVFATYVTFKVMGSNYDSAVLAAGHCGFGMGATPTAIANMQVITDRFGPSPKAYLLVPMVGAFFVDLANAMVIKLFIFFIQ